MGTWKLMEVRRQVLKELMTYRHTCTALKNGGTVGREALAWTRVIAEVQNALKEADPEKARFMARVFGLEHPIPQRRTARERLLRLSREMHCSEATLYNWRAEIVELVVIGAVEAGLIHVFQAQKGGRGRKKTV